jgi:predicted outer membrane repeat protein
VKIVKKQTLLVLTAFLVAVAISGASYANGMTDVYVSPDGDDTTGTGDENDPFETVGKGVDTVTSGGTVNLAAGTYDQDNGGVSTDYGINIAKDLTIQGAGKDQTFIDALGLDRIFRIDDGYTVTLKDLTIMNGDTSGKGGGVKVRPGSTLNVINCNFIDNTADGDGGAICNLGTTTVTNCLFNNNVADSGGAIYNEYGATLTVTGSTFTANIAEGGQNDAIQGGAIYTYLGILQVIGNNFLNNMGNAIYVNAYSNGNGAAGPLIFKINVNRIVGNTPYGLYVNTPVQIRDLAAASDGIHPIDATNNWWGSNNDPRTMPGTIYDPMNFADTTKWLVLKIGANPNSVPFGSTSLVTASVIYNNLGEDTSSIGHIPDGTPITITTDIGNVGSKSVTLYTVGGIVTTILRANDGLGTANLFAILDGFSTPLPAQVVITAAASTVSAQTIGMQETGLPILPILLALMMVLGGLYGGQRKIRGV